VSNVPPHLRGKQPLVALEDLKVHFPVYEGVVFRRVKSRVKAVDGLTLDIFPGETVGLVGESGCGKSTTGRAILQLYEHNVAQISGHVRYGGVDLCKIGHARNAVAKMRPYRRHLQIIFQDPYASLNPRMNVGNIVGEPLKVHKLASGAAALKRVGELLEIVGLSPAMMKRYPHEFSGGQRQRIGIARALAVDPKFIVCDEPISALDVSIQAQVMNLMMDLQERFDLTYLFIAHDLSAVKHISDRIAVMYLGKIVELAAADDVYHRPQHPYSRALISAVPVADPRLARTGKRIILEGDVPSPMNPPSGCRFHTRCAYAEAICGEVEPKLEWIAPGHQVACHLVVRGDDLGQAPPGPRTMPAEDPPSAPPAGPSSPAGQGAPPTPAPPAPPAVPAAGSTAPGEGASPAAAPPPPPAVPDAASAPAGEGAASTLAAPTPPPPPAAPPRPTAPPSPTAPEVPGSTPKPD